MNIPLKELLGLVRAFKREQNSTLVTLAGLVEKLPLLVDRIPSGAQIEQIKTRALELERLTQTAGADTGDAAIALGDMLTPLLARTFSPAKAAAPAGGYRLNALFTPSADELGAMWPVYGSALAMAIVQVLRELSDTDDQDSEMQWGAFQKAAVSKGQWWRVFTHAFVHTDKAHAAGDIAAVMSFGTAIARLESPALAFSMLRLGIFVGLLSVIFNRDSEEPVVSVSGPAFCLLGALVTAMLLNRQKIKPPTAEDVPAGMVVFMTGFNLLGRSVAAKPELARAHTLAALAGAAGAGLAHIIAQVERKTHE